MRSCRLGTKKLCAALLACAVNVCAAAQTSPAPPPASTPDVQQPQDQPPLPPPQGKVLFERHGASPEPDSDRHPLAAPAAPDLHVTDAERAAWSVTAYDLDAHIAPARAELAMRARLTLRNDGATPLPRVVLQISSPLHWESAALAEATGMRRLDLAQAPVDSDLDHTGRVNEGVFTLPHPLAPGASATLELLYTGPVSPSSERLQRIGAFAAQAGNADWDAIAPDAIALRGFGNVLWYPVAAPPAFLGEGAKLFDAVGHMRLREEAATVRLRLAVEFNGAPPTAAYFCGRRRTFTVLTDSTASASVPAEANLPGIARAEWPAAPLGFRALDLFTAAAPEQLLPADANPPLLAVETAQPGILPRLGAAAQDAAGLLSDSLGPRPLTALTILDHPGQPFEDGPLLVAPADSLASSEAVPALVHSLTHAWVDSGQPWIDDGLAQFFALQYTEREHGRDAALAQMHELLQPLPLGEPGFTSAAEAAAGAPGQPLIAAWSDIFYRRKAAAVWWMLRDIAGDNAFKAALSAFRALPPEPADPRAHAIAFEHLLEKTSGKDLAWFFRDWVLRDPGLPDLVIADVTPRTLPAGPGHDAGWLVAVTVRNDGGAAAEVPVVVRSATAGRVFSTTRRLRIDAFSSATDRVLVEAEPTEVMVNDGTVPEVRTSLHTRSLTIRTQ